MTDAEKLDRAEAARKAAEEIMANTEKYDWHNSCQCAAGRFQKHLYGRFAPFKRDETKISGAAYWDDPDSPYTSYFPAKSAERGAEVLLQYAERLEREVTGFEGKVFDFHW